jgi:hypothetical protein
MIGQKQSLIESPENVEEAQRKRKKIMMTIQRGQDRTPGRFRIIFQPED